jgi:hypothetical protein
LAPTDPKYLKISQTRSDHLDRRFEAVKTRIADALAEYVIAQQSQEAASAGQPRLAEPLIAEYRVDG